MRIVGGKFKGHHLATPADSSTRPTSDRVREAIFNILEHSIADFSIVDARVLDLFAGTGALGLEAISRGSRYCHFIDDGAAARGLIRTNADKLGVIGQAKIWRRDATKLGPCAPLPAFELVFADPPYNKGLGEKALRSLAEGGWLTPGAIVVLEEADKAVLPEITGLEQIDTRAYGETVVRFYRKIADNGSAK